MPITDALKAIINDPTPQSAGKLKSMWDALRSTPLPGSEGQLPMGGAPPAPVTPPPQAAPPQQNIGVTTDQAPPPVPVDMPHTLSDAITNVEAPDARMAAPNLNDMPSAASLKALQAKAASLDEKPSLMGRLKNALPGLAIAGVGAALGAPSAAQGVEGAQELGLQQKNAQRTALTAQIEAAQRGQSSEYEAAERTREQANAAAEANKTRQIVADTGGRYRLAGSEVMADSRRDVADTNAGSREKVATIGAGSREAVANTAAAARIKAGKYAADAANGRLTRTINAAADRQQRGFTHTDEKPTADEDRRADLAQSFSDVADEIKEIANRRPELFGPGAGRWTSLKSLVGTSDPDIAALHADKEALGQIMLGAHAMRNAQHIGTAANSVINSFNNQPAATIAGIEAAKKNANTMQTITRPTLAGRVANRPAASAPTTGAVEYDYISGKGMVPRKAAK